MDEFLSYSIENHNNLINSCCFLNNQQEKNKENIFGQLCDKNNGFSLDYCGFETKNVMAKISTLYKFEYRHNPTYGPIIFLKGKYATSLLYDTRAILREIQNIELIIIFHNERKLLKIKWETFLCSKSHYINLLFSNQVGQVEDKSRLFGEKSKSTQLPGGESQSLFETLRSVLQLKVNNLKNMLILEKEKYNCNREIDGKRILQIERKIKQLSDYSTIDMIRFWRNTYNPDFVAVGSDGDIQTFLRETKQLLNKIRFPLSLHLSYIFNSIHTLSSNISTFVSDPSQTDSGEIKDSQSGQSSTSHHEYFKLNIALNSNVEFYFEISKHERDLSESLKRRVERIYNSKKRKIIDVYDDHVNSRTGGEKKLKLCSSSTPVHTDDSFNNKKVLLSHVSKLAANCGSSSLVTCPKTKQVQVTEKTKMDLKNYFGSCGNSCCESTCACLGRSLQLRENIIRNKENDIYDSDSPPAIKKRRATALKFNKPLLIKLYEFGLVTKTFITSLGNEHALKYCLFMDIINSSDAPANIFFISITYYDEKEDKMVSIKSRSFTDDNWADTFLEYYNTSLKKCLKVVVSRLKKKFEYVLSKLKKHAIATLWKGFFAQCYKECVKYVSQISIFTFMMDTKTKLKLNMLLLFIKSTSKSFMRRVHYSSDGHIIKIETNEFCLRDMSNFFMDRADVSACEKDPCLKMKYLQEFSTEIVTSLGKNKPPTKPTPQANSSSTGRLPQPQENNEFSLADLFLYYNTFMSNLFPGFNLLFINHSSISSLSLAVSSYEANSLSTSKEDESEKQNKLYNISLFKNSCRTLEIINNFIYGGLSVRARPFIKKDHPVRPTSEHSFLPINSLFIYDIKGMYSSVMKDNDLICGYLNHYELLSNNNKKKKKKNATSASPTDLKCDQDYSLKLVRDTTFFYSEFKSIMFLIWSIEKNLETATYISNIFSNYNGNSCVQIANNQIDLTVIIRNSKSDSINKIYFMNIHNVFTHTCPKCSFIFQDNDNQEESGKKKKYLDQKINYKGGKSYEEVYKQSSENDDHIVNMVKCIKNSQYLVYYSCCELKKGIEKYSTIFQFFKQFDLMKKYDSHFLNPPVKISFKNIIQVLKRGDVCPAKAESANTKTDDETFNRLINAFYVVKLNIPMCQEEQEEKCQFGYIIGKSCISCGIKESTTSTATATSSSSSTVSSTHVTKTTASFNSYSYVMIDGPTLHFLLKEKNAQVEKITHVFTYITSPSWRPFVKKILRARQESINNNFNFLNKGLKLLLNSLIGRLQLRAGIGLNTKTDKRLYFTLPRRLKENSDQIVSIAYAGQIFNKTAHYVTFRRLPPTKDSFFFNQGHIVNGIKILQCSKTVLLEYFNLFDKYFDGKRYSYVQTQTDSITLAASLNPDLITNRDDWRDEAIFSLLKPEYRNDRKSLERRFFSNTQVSKVTYNLISNLISKMISLSISLLISNYRSFSISNSTSKF